MMETQQVPDPGTRNILDVCRRVMLMEPVAGDFNQLPMTEPTQRVKAVAMVLVNAANEHDFIRRIVEETGVIKSLHAMARDRAGGEISLPTLLADLPRMPEREAA
jgi:hypothetical protein